MKKKLGLALGAGGARGVAHVGFLQALDDAGIRADFVTGCSMGSIVGACYCAGVSMAEVRPVVTGLKLSRIASLNANMLRACGLFRLNKARKLLEEYIGEETTFLSAVWRAISFPGKRSVSRKETSLTRSLLPVPFQEFFCPLNGTECCLWTAASSSAFPSGKSRKWARRSSSPWTSSEIL